MSGPPKIVLTGASGFIGRLLVARLQAAGAGLLLVGRSAERLNALFPDVPACTYDNLPEAGRGHTLLVHLAVANTDSDLTEAEMRRVNIDLALDVARAAAAAGIPRMLNLSSTHALEASRDTAYARSKREAAERLQDIGGIGVRTVYLPLVYADRWPGRLTALNRLPHPLARAVFAVLAALKPVCHVDRLAEHILNGAPEEIQILSDRQLTNPVYKVAARGLDLLFVVAVAGLLGWLLLIVWVLIRLDSSGPGIFAQDRVGREGRVFTCYKFRTMAQGTRQAGTHEVSAASITRIGGALRSTKIDEFPQILNILKGEMSLIGPRPCLPVQHDVIEERRIRGVLQIKPGISGLAQINDIDMSDAARLGRWDARYLALRTVPLDFKILFRTMRGGGRGDKVAR